MTRECLFNIIVDEHADLFKSDVEATVEVSSEEDSRIEVDSRLLAVKDYRYAIAKGMLSFIS